MCEGGLHAARPSLSAIAGITQIDVDESSRGVKVKATPTGDAAKRAAKGDDSREGEECTRGGHFLTVDVQPTFSIHTLSAFPLPDYSSSSGEREGRTSFRDLFKLSWKF